MLGIFNIDLREGKESSYFHTGFNSFAEGYLERCHETLTGHRGCYKYLFFWNLIVNDLPGESKKYTPLTSHGE